MANERVWSLATIEEFWSKVKNLVSGYKIKQTAVSDPSASGTGVTFIDSISQNANGVIAPTKKTVRTMGGASASAAGSAGLAPAPAAGSQGKFLRGDGSWVNTPYPGTMTGATASTAGSAGLVPAPSAGNQDKFLKGDGTWGEGLSPNNVANNLTTEAAGKVLDARQGKALKDNISDLGTELSAVESGLAYRETGATASRNISDGAYVFWNGAMYTANGNIASGTTLVSGTNLTPTENALNALNSNLTWTLLAEVNSWDGVSVNITPYHEVLIILWNSSAKTDATWQGVYPVSVALAAGFVGVSNRDNSTWARILNGNLFKTDATTTYGSLYVR